MPVEAPYNIFRENRISRQDLLGRETELVQAFRETEEGLKELNELDVRHLDTPLETAHKLLQHLENQQPRVNALQSEISQLQTTCTPEERGVLTEKSRELDQTTKVPWTLNNPPVLFLI